jgi:putative transposase
MMITKMNKTCKQYKTKELCQLLKLSRSSYYYQIKDKPVSSNTHNMIKFIKQTALEVGHTYGKRRMRVSLNNHYQSFANHQEVVENVESYLYFYNYKRIHSAIGYLTPVEKMAELKKVA